MFRPLSPCVQELARKLFAQRADRVLASLQDAEFHCATPLAEERVHLAILVDSQGDMSRCESALRCAKEDWRDLLMVSALATDKWVEVLREQGIFPSHAP